MTDAPERIITALEVGQAKRRITDPSETQPMTLSDVVQYRRDDLPPTLAEAAQVILTAIERAQIDMRILRMMLNGEPATALRALAKLTEGGRL